MKIFFIKTLLNKRMLFFMLVSLLFIQCNNTASTEHVVMVSENKNTKSE